MSIRLIFTVVVMWLMSFCAVWAQSGTSVLHHQEHEEVIVEGRRDPSSPSCQKVSYADVKALPVASVNDALKLMGSANIKDYGGIGGLSTVSVRGLGASHTLVSYDGIQISNAQAGQVDISRFSFNPDQELKLNIARAGHLATAREYASPATLNIVTGNPKFREGKRDAISASLRAGSFGYISSDVVYSRKVGAGSWLRAEGEYTTANGEYPFTLTNVKAVTRERRINTDVLSCKGEISCRINGSAITVDLKGYAYKSERGLPGSVVLYNKEANERLDDKNCFLQGSIHRNLGNRMEAKIYAKANYANSLYEDTNLKYAGGKLIENSTQREMYMSEVFMAYINKVWRSVSISIDETRSTLESTIKNCPQPDRNTLQGAMDLRFEFLGARCNLTGIYTRVREQVTTGSHFRCLDKWKPALRISRAFSRPYLPDIAIAYKSAFRVPTFNELYYTSLGSTGLSPESAQEFSIDLSWPSISMSLYRNYVIDKIVAIPTTYVWKMANYGKVEITGADFSASKDIDLNICRLSLSAKYAYQKAINLNGKNPKLRGGQVPYTPVHSGSCSASASTRIVTIGYSAIWSGKRYCMEYNCPDSEIEPYIEHSLSLSRELSFLGADYAVKMSCTNLANKQYDVIKYYPMPGRQWRISIITTI